MTVIDKLREAIVSERWDIVKEVFEEFGGKLEEVKKKSKVKNKVVEETEEDIAISERDDVLIHGLVSEKNIEKVLSEPVIKRRANEDFLAPIKGQRQRESNPTRVDEHGNEVRLMYSEPFDRSKSKINLFEDDLSLASQDIAFSKKVITRSPVTRQPRNEAVEIEAECKSCGRRDKVLPQFAAHYRCNKCMVATR